MKKLNQKGFGVVEGLLIVVVVALVGVVGWLVYDRQKTEPKTDAPITGPPSDPFTFPEAACCCAIKDVDRIRNSPRNTPPI